MIKNEIIERDEEEGMGQRYCTDEVKRIILFLVSRNVRGSSKKETRVGDIQNIAGAWQGPRSNVTSPQGIVEGDKERCISREIQVVHCY